MTHIDLFSGIGGFSLAARWAGFDTLCHCEIDPFCRAVLAKNFPAMPTCENVNGFTEWFVSHFGDRSVDLLTGGFPCQGISSANPDGTGLADERSGLWFAMLAVITRIRPAYVVVENVPNLYSRGVDIVLSGLEEAGYTCGAFVVGGWVVGAPHKRDRVFIVAQCNDVPHADGEQLGRRPGSVAEAACEEEGGADTGGRMYAPTGDFCEIDAGNEHGRQVADATCRRWETGSMQEHEWDATACAGSQKRGSKTGDKCAASLGYTGGDGRARLPRRRAGKIIADRPRPTKTPNYAWQVGNAHLPGGEEQRLAVPARTKLAPPRCAGGRRAQPGVGRNADGVPGRLDGSEWFVSFPAPPSEKGTQFRHEPPRLKKGVANRENRLRGCGNALTPQQVYPILVTLREKIEAEGQHAS